MQPPNEPSEEEVEEVEEVEELLGEAVVESPALAPASLPHEAAGITTSAGGALHFDINDTRYAMLQSLDYFAGVALPDICTKPYSNLHRSIWKAMTDAVLQEDWEGVARLAIGIPRGHSKTQMIKLLILFVILFTDIRFVLVVCATHGHAANLLGDVCDMLDSDNIRALFGDWRSDIEKDNNENKIFTFMGRTVILKPQGANGSIRGANIKNTRPELIICDDMQSREEAMSPDVARKNLEWFSGTLYKARSPHRCAFFYIGNMYPDLEIGGRGSNVYGCILRNLQRNPDWLSYIGAAILSDGTALWEDVIPLKELLADLRQDTQFGQPEIFFSELMNDPKASGSKFLDTNKIPDHRYVEGVDMVAGKYLVIDPSLGKKKSDDQIVGMFYVYDDTGPVYREARNIMKSAPELVREVLTWALTEGIPLICAESVAYQATLIQWFCHYIELLEIEGIEIIGVTPQGMSKPSRILVSFKSIMRGSLHLHPDVKPLVVNQALIYSPTRANNTDDILEVGAYGEHVFIAHSDAYLLPLEGMVVDKPRTSRLSEEAEEADYSTVIDIPHMR